MTIYLCLYLPSDLGRDFTSSHLQSSIQCGPSFWTRSMMSSCPWNRRFARRPTGCPTHGFFTYFLLKMMFFFLYFLLENADMKVSPTDIPLVFGYVMCCFVMFCPNVIYYDGQPTKKKCWWCCMILPVYSPEVLRWNLKKRWFPKGISFSRGWFSGSML